MNNSIYNKTTPKTNKQKATTTIKTKTKLKTLQSISENFTVFCLVKIYHIPLQKLLQKLIIQVHSGDDQKGSVNILSFLIEFYIVATVMIGSLCFNILIIWFIDVYHFVQNFL